MEHPLLLDIGVGLIAAGTASCVFGVMCLDAIRLLRRHGQPNEDADVVYRRTLDSLRAERQPLAWLRILSVRVVWRATSRP
jgi:hypothetical protein